MSNNSIEQVIDCYLSAIHHILATYHLTCEETIELCNTVDYMRKILEEGCSPENYFKAMATGAFKECYSLIPNKFIIKFTTNANETDNELKLIAEAENDDIGEIFLPTYWIPFGDIKVESTLIDNDDLFEDSQIWDEENETYVDNPDFEYPFLNGCMIQPWAIVQEKEPYFSMSLNPHDYNKNPVKYSTGEVVDYNKAYGFFVTSQTWLQSIIDIYGDDFFNRLSDFIKRNSVSDLHNSNIGYYINEKVKYPVILDCLSHFC